MDHRIITMSNQDVITMSNHDVITTSNHDVITMSNQRPGGATQAKTQVLACYHHE